MDDDRRKELKEVFCLRGFHCRVDLHCFSAACFITLHDSL